MHGTKISAGSRENLARAPRLSVLPVLAIMLLAASPASSLADEATIAAQPLKEAIKANTSLPARFVLSDGKTVIGRIVRIDGDALTVRRPSAGLASLAVADIVGVNFKPARGDLLRGRITRMADGGIGWLADDDAGLQSRGQLAAKAPKDPSETGGPLILLDDEDLKKVDVPNDDGAATSIALKPVDTVTPEFVTPVQSEPIRLVVTADSVKESDKLMYFRLSLSAPAPRSILVIYTTINGTAVAPGDYTHRQGTVVFEPGQSQALVATSVVNDDAAEGAETFAFFVTGDPATVAIAERKIAATIEDDDDG